MTPTERITDTYDRAPRDLYHQGMRWYQDAHEWCQSNHVHPGVVAALSPQLGWEDNKYRALRLTHHGERIGINLFVDRAQAIIDGAPALDVLGGSKVRSFYRNLADPYDEDPVTIDRHAFAIAHPRTPIKRLERKGEYERVADLYRKAAAERDILPLQIQAVTWCVRRGTSL